MKYSLMHIILLTLVVVSNGCGHQNPTEKDMSEKCTEELIRILEDQNGPDNLFSAVTKELANRGPSASEAAPALSLALTYPRGRLPSCWFCPNGYGRLTLNERYPPLFIELLHERSTVRRYAALTLGTIGEASECAVPRLASLLWYPRLETRSWSDFDRCYSRNRLSRS